MKKNNNKKHKWLKWEFWPFWLFYIPVYFQYLYYSIRTGSFGFFSASNPLMTFGGFSNYSKSHVLKAIHEDYIPITHLLTPPFGKSSPTDFGLSFPVIMKPDMGERGFLVEVIHTQQAYDAYLAQSKFPVVLQEFIDYPIELGVMYHRFPRENKGHITSVVRKEVLSVIGDGVSTLAELITKGERTHYHQKMLFEQYAHELNNKLEHGERKQLSHIGNHIRGATFYNANHLINESLHKVFDKIALPIEGYHFGRFDLKVPSLDDLYAGKNIKIVELNGANSEPTHIYDPSMPLLKAYKAMFAHWRTLYRISKANHKTGVPYTSIWTIVREVRNSRKQRKSDKASIVDCL